ncbi:MAG: hypothetical protein Q9174_002434 [Haloplaca sp. 1 TL-2023]
MMCTPGPPQSNVKAKGQVTVKYNDFETPIFTLIAGPEGVTKTYTAHQGFLAKSPVFKKMCQAESFKEGETFQIRLPEDKPRVVEAILDFLYADSWELSDEGCCVIVDAFDGMTDMAELLVDVYVAADKFQLPDLKNDVIEEMRGTIDGKDRSAEFLYMAKAVYASLPECEDPFRDFVKATVSAYERLRDWSPKAREVFEGCIVDGGLLALDLHNARCK